MARLTFKNGLYIFICTFDERGLAKQAGLRWDKARRVWFTPDTQAAARLREYADGPASLELKRLTIVQAQPWSTPLPVPEGLELLPHQPDGVKFILERNRSYLGADPGLGKTIMAAVACAAIPFEPVVYICPPFLLKNTASEFKKWAPTRRIGIYPGARAGEFDTLLVPDSLIARDECVAYINNFVRFASNKTIILDEAHRFKNETRKRTEAVFGYEPVKGLVDEFTRQVYMSGTPMPNRPIELYSVLSKAAPESIDFMSRFQYASRFCAAYHDGFAWNFTGSSNMPELKTRIQHPTGNFMLRQRKDLLKDLPPKIEEVFVVSNEMGSRLAKLDATLGEQYDSGEDLIKHAIANKHDRAGEELPLVTYRRLLGQEKAQAAIPYIESLLEETEENLLVFAYFKDTVSILQKGLYNHRPLVITGDTKVSARDGIVKEFQTDASRRLMIGNYAAMGVGFTITKATRVLFVEFDWVPGVNDQAADRTHRIGQTGTVTVQYMVFEGSIDKAVIDTLLRKRKSTQYV